MHVVTVERDVDCIKKEELFHSSLFRYKENKHVGKDYRIKRGMNEMAKDSIIVSTPSKRQATMAALNSAMGNMTLSGGAVRASPDLHMFAVLH